jgi:hypothetical protein
VSDTPIDGWWRAKDGRWYPPETHPRVASGPVAPPPGWVRRADGTWGPPPGETDTRVADETDARDSDPERTHALFGSDAAVAGRLVGPPSAPTGPEVTVVHVPRRGRSPRVLVGGAFALIVLFTAAYLASRWVSDSGQADPVDASTSVRTTTTRRPRTTTTSSTTTSTVPTTLATTTVAPTSTTVATAAPPTTPPTTAPTRTRRRTTTTQGIPFFPPVTSPPPAPPATAPPTTHPPTTHPPTTAPPTTQPEPTVP